MQIVLGWNTSDAITGAIRELHERDPKNMPLTLLYRQLATGNDEPITLKFNDDLED